MLIKTNLRKIKTTKFQDNVNVEFVVIFYYIMINKINERLLYRKCYKKIAFNNLLHIYLKLKNF